MWKSFSKLHLTIERAICRINSRFIYYTDFGICYPTLYNHKHYQNWSRELLCTSSLTMVINHINHSYRSSQFHLILNFEIFSSALAETKSTTQTYWFLSEMYNHLTFTFKSTSDHFSTIILPNHLKFYYKLNSQNDSIRYVRVIVLFGPQFIWLDWAKKYLLKETTNSLNAHTDSIPNIVTLTFYNLTISPLVARLH